MRIWALQVVGIFALALGVGACTVKETEAPAVSGPSELALSMNLHATPDLVYQDGTSQSAITIEALGPTSQPVRGASFRVDMRVNGTAGDFGTLSTRTLVTGDDGRARATYTAPPRPAPGTPASTVTFVATPIGGDYRGEFSREVDIKVVPPGVILPPNTIDPKFIFSPTAVSTFQPVTFDASTTTDSLVPCGSNCSYSWSFGDGGSSSGQVTSHEFRAAGSFVVVLRVTNANGQTAQSVPQTLVVTAGTPPTAAFTFSPTAPRISQDIFFTAQASRAANGRSIIAYDWDFGSGRTGSGVSVAKRYDTAGTYVVTLTVVDDAFQQTTVSQTVTVTP